MSDTSEVIQCATITKLTVNSPLKLTTGKCWGESHANQSRVGIYRRGEMS